jgi:hypothetical protein
MMQRSLASTIYFKACLFVLYFVAASASFNGFYDKWHLGEADMSGEDPRFNFEMMVDGTAYKPYIDRQMLPTLADWIDRGLPPSFETRLYNSQLGGPNAATDPWFDSPTAENPVYFFRYLLVYAGTFLFALLAVYAMRLVCTALEVPEPAAALAPAFVILLIPYLQSVGGFFYDYSELAFFAIAVWIALRFRWWWMVPIAALGTWNKESFLLFIPTLYPFLRRRSSRPVALPAVGGLCLVCLAVYLPIRLHFAQNPGGAVETHWRDQLRFFMDWRNLAVGTEKTYGVPMLKALTVLPMALCVWTVWRGWPHLPHMVRRHGQIAAFINLPLYVLFCWPGELRDLSMLYVVFLLVLAHDLNDWLCGSRILNLS